MKITKIRKLWLDYTCQYWQSINGIYVETSKLHNTKYTKLKLLHFGNWNVNLRKDENYMKFMKLKLWP